MLQVGTAQLSEGSEDLHSDQDEDVESKVERLKQAKQDEQRIARHNGMDAHVSTSKAKAKSSKDGSAEKILDMNFGESSEADSDWGISDKPGEFATDGLIRIQSKNAGVLNSSNTLVKSQQNGVQYKAIDGGRADLEYLLKGKPQNPQKLANGSDVKSQKTAKSVTISPSVQSNDFRDEDDESKAVIQDGEVDEQPAFLPSKAFKGTKTGYIFTSGTQGTGYYRETANKTTKKKANSKKSGKKVADMSTAVEDSIAEAAVEQFVRSSDDEEEARPGLLSPCCYEDKIF